MINQPLLTAYAENRRRAWHEGSFKPLEAQRALTDARATVADKHPQYSHHVKITAPTYHNESFGDALRFFERPEDFGFREVSDAGKFYRDACQWYADAFQDETISGVVFQLPARRGRVRLFAGYRTSDDDDNAAVIRLRAVDTINSREGEPDDSDYRDAARYADGLAEDAAEKARDYDNAWNAGREYADNRDAMRANGKTLRKLRQELRSLPAGTSDVVRGLIYAQIDCERQEIARTLKENATLKDGDNADFYFYVGDAEMRNAFNDGAGAVILK